ncbi:MAG: 6-phosphogluconolactonase [Deltaproteobacteria bacterium]|nr:6-phosphogluconolactonase [Deltaproteobacteria bacterium]
MAAEYICTVATESARERGAVSFALAGGGTPKPVYECLAGSAYAGRMPWPRVHIFWGDERCVPPDHPYSNYGMALRAMISRVPIPRENVHRILGEESPERAAEAYEQTLRRFFASPGVKTAPAGGRGFPCFDLILLGLGKDGHTASLFPGDPALEEKHRWVVPVGNPIGEPPVPRVSLSLPVINRAGGVVFLVSGKAKQEVVRSVVEGRETGHPPSPAARVRPEGRLVWFVDGQAWP